MEIYENGKPAEQNPQVPVSVESDRDVVTNMRQALLEQ